MPNDPKTPTDEDKKEKKAQDKRLDDELDDTFPASDPPASTAPGHGATGAEVKRDKGAQSPS